MSAQIVQIGRHRFVSGLFWQSLSRRRELRKEALELARKLQFDLLLVHIERDHAEAGFANLSDGIPPGMLSLGTMVSSAIVRQGAMYDGRQQPAPNWMGAFKVPDGRWAYFAVRDNLFLPNGDWIGTREEVFERLLGDYALGGWNVVIGDEELEPLGFHNFYRRDLEELMPRRNGKPHVHRWWALRRARRSLRLPLALAAVAMIFCASALGYVKYRQHQQAIAFARMVEMQRKIAATAGKQAPAEVHPWAHEPSPSALAARCLEHFGQLAPGGWQLSRYECSGTSASYVWDRHDSTIAFLLNEVPHAQIDGTGEHAAWHVPLSAPPAGDDALLPESRVRERLFQAFQSLSISLKLNAAPRPEPAQNTHSTVSLTQRPPPPTWREWRLSADLAGLSPLSVAQALDAPGVRLQHLTYQDGTWSIEGVVYAN
jgi:hypothetical protein